jgi:cation-transporting ATPase 13A3/4/5
VAFCGDGANDCAALKAADVGVSLSDLEASIAAPFTSRIRNIKCMPSVIREGRSALVTSFMAFKYMALYSMIQFTTLILLYSNRKNLGNWEFLYIDLVIILSIALLMGRTEAAPTLAAKRPTASLVSGKVLTSLVGHVLVQALFQSALLVFTKQQPWYVDPLPTKGRLTILSADTTTLFLFSSLQYISLAIVFSVGKPYRKPFYTNGRFTGWI